MKRNEQRIIKMLLSSVVTILLFTNGMAVLADDNSTDMASSADVNQELPAGDTVQTNEQTRESVDTPEAAESALASPQETEAAKPQEEEISQPQIQSQTEAAVTDASQQNQTVPENVPVQDQAENSSGRPKQLQTAPAAKQDTTAVKTAADQKDKETMNLTTDKASYQSGEAVHLNLTLTNTSPLAQDITATAEVYSLENKLDTLRYSKYLLPNESYRTQKGDLTIPAGSLANNRGYLLMVEVSDSQNTFSEKTNRAIAVEDDWRTFPRYGAIGGSQKDNNSVLTKNLPTYYQELEQMKNMNINSYFFYDVYKSTTNPFPNVPKFDQTWNWWSHSQVETDAVKALVNRVHQTGAAAMLYNMVLAQNTNEMAVLPDTEYIYNYENGGYGPKGQVMTYFIDDKPLQYYYNPLSEDWQNYISNAMAQALGNGGFDGWQGDTIGDNRVLDYDHKDSQDFADSFMLSDVYGEFINKMKEKLPQYYLTINDINGENINKLASSKQDVIYNELWPFGTSALGNRPQESYGDLKARIDQVRQATGKSLIVGAYMEEPKFDDNGTPLNGAARDALASATYQTDAVLLTTAAIAAAGGYHMSLAALAHPNDGNGVGVLETAYYPTQSLRVSEELNRKNYHYQQFITAYENLLRDQVENDTVEPQTFAANGQQVSHDILGISGNQVWTYAKKGKDFRTIQMLNLMGITSDWKNEDGYENNKTPDEQTNLLVTYPLTGMSMAEANRIAKQVYLTSPDDWLQSSMISLAAQVKTDENGDPVLHIQVPRLTLWNMIYITEAIKPEQPQKPAKSFDFANPEMPELVKQDPRAEEQAVNADKEEATPILTDTENDLQRSALSQKSLQAFQENTLPRTGDSNKAGSHLTKAAGVGALLVGAVGLLSLIKDRKNEWLL